MFELSGGDNNKVILKNKEHLLSQRDLAASVAHELRNPLAAIRGFLQLLGERVVDEIDRNYINLVMWELGRLERLVEDFICLGRLSARLESRDLETIVREVVAVGKPIAECPGVNLSFVAEPCPPIMVDRYLIKQVLWNLIKNSVEAMPGGGELILRLALVNEKELELTVRDTGIGIPKDIQFRVFEPYFTTKDTGTGLGLSICYEIIKLHGGSLHLKSEEGQGTTVSIRLPVGPGEDPGKQ